MSHSLPHHDHPPAELTPNRQLVIDVLVAANRAVSAYDVLQLLRDRNVNWQPPTVYRALNFLAEAGLVHYIQSIQKYMACHHQHCGHVTQLLICNQCGAVQEVPIAENLVSALEHQAADYHFTMVPQFIELQGICQACQTH
jgi:Fur family zinc uptake transcriptional regulator